ncbi:DUF370 domain-containing protein [Thermosipho atlanticus]|uniref:DUF370 domain-containing protein n=1 Tax=Thermosipho atlanticus DSM 15807 TaxID=1123380 RepID=A0A1M5T3A3_9BACT|nr:DUF370 domain-containing protein [Thermosipho atlanticus]SHH45221.1 protein of unknown function [Thermosipho atlanticus DSM 15807]
MKQVIKLTPNIFIPKSRIIAILPISSSIARKIRGLNKIGEKIVNITYGEEAKTILIMDSGHILVSSKTLEEVDEALWK